MRIAILNGPNLNMLGQREPEIYGSVSFEEFLDDLSVGFPEVELVYFQSNHEGDLIDTIQAEGFLSDGIIINAGGFSHSSVSIADALSLIPAPAVEVHISNIYAREPFRHKSLLAPVCKGSIVGLGLAGYQFAIQYLLQTANS
ncbi:MAG TPA: type II 3-dehydroquinate dehydratase [Catalimonadaceae bacterium]|jgi:3-dehydroquinate dehydratase-2|nr:type II 3-dehydroquinate dehydratase [Catalimonadaceae bacterium]